MAESLTTDAPADAVAGAEAIGAPEPELQKAYTGALIWANELSSAGFAA